MTIPADPGRQTASPADSVRAAPTAATEVGRETGEPPEIRILRVLSDAARDMHRSLSLGEVIRVATDRARQIVGAQEAATTQTTGREWTHAVTSSSTADGGPPRWLRAPDATRGGPAHEVCRTNRPLRLSWVDSAAPGAAVDATVDAPVDAPAGHWNGGSGAWIGAPLVGSDGRNLGLIQLAGKVGGTDFSAGDEAVLQQLARMASVAVENARLYQAALDAREQLSLAAHVERVRAAELRAVINAMGEAVLVCDPTGAVDFANAAADALFGARPITTWDDLLSRFGLPAEPVEPLDPVAAPVELALPDVDRWFELRVYPVAGVARPSEDGGVGSGKIAVLRDVTAARQLRAQREAFLGILSHELRTPITTIYAGSKVLARDDRFADGTARELAADISAEAERLFRLVEDLLVMTRIERGSLQLTREPVLLQRVVASSVRLESAHWPTTRIRLEEHVDLPAVAGDATYVEQVTRNLLSNAAKYSPPEAEVTIKLRADDDEVICCVLDRGRGFQSDEAEDLFDLFYRSPATSAQAAGAGIGLFVCRRLVTAMGGRIWARPRPGGGAEFGFALRRYDES